MIEAITLSGAGGVVGIIVGVGLWRSHPGVRGRASHKRVSLVDHDGIYLFGSGGHVFRRVSGTQGGAPGPDTGASIRVVHPE